MGSKKLGIAWAMSLAGAGAMGMVIAGGAGQAGDQPEQEMPAEMQEWMQTNQPGEKHKALNALAGDFKADMWFKMAPDAPRETSTGTSQSEWIMDGRYLTSHFNADFMGMPFEGHGVMGYDTVKKHYFTGWIDNMSTGLFTEHGEMSNDGKTLTMHGSMIGPDGSEMTTKHVYKVISNDKHVMEFWEAPKGEKLVNTGAITYTRQ